MVEYLSYGEAFGGGEDGELYGHDAQMKTHRHGTVSSLAWLSAGPTDRPGAAGRQAGDEAKLGALRYKV
jgi:hypothetical protein